MMVKMIEKMANEVKCNRAIFLAAMRSGKYQKGTVISDDKGRPIIESEADEGYCVVGLMYSLFHPTDRRKALNITQPQCSKIQHEWNDSALTFTEIADLIENQMF